MAYKTTIEYLSRGFVESCLAKKYKQPKNEELTPEDWDYCKKCGHWVDIRLLNREELTRHFFEKLCKFCQREVEDPNPERTKRIIGEKHEKPWRLSEC